MLKFTKMTGCGNDYVYINCFEERAGDPAELSKRVSDRHFGIGSDGLVYNSDGSRAEMCGNAIRCVGKYVHDRGIINKDVITVETLAGIKTLTLHLDENGSTKTLTVDMGTPILAPDKIPVVSEEEPVKALALTAHDKTMCFHGQPSCGHLYRYSRKGF